MFYIQVPDDILPQTIPKRLNDHLPEGLVVDGCEVFSGGKRQKTTAASVVKYLITLGEGVFDASKCNRFAESSTVIITRRNRKGTETTLDLKEIVLEMVPVCPNQLQLSLKTAPGKTLRPQDVIGPVFDLRGASIKQARVIKTAVSAIPEGI